MDDASVWYIRTDKKITLRVLCCVLFCPCLCPCLCRPKELAGRGKDNARAGGSRQHVGLDCGFVVPVAATSRTSCSRNPPSPSNDDNLTPSSRLLWCKCLALASLLQSKPRHSCPPVHHDGNRAGDQMLKNNSSSGSL